MTPLARQTLRLATESVWPSYASVFALMNDVPFVKDLRDRHALAMMGRRRVVDAGCGVGLIARVLAEAGDRAVIGVDMDAAMLEKAAGRLRGVTNTWLVQADIERMPIATGTCDGYVSNNVLYCVDDPARVLAEAARVTRTGGVISLSSPRPGMDVEILLHAMLVHLRAIGVDPPAADLERFAAANRRLQRELKHVLEPDDAERLLGPRWRVVEAGITYLDQNFLLVAVRTGLAG